MTKIVFNKQQQEAIDVVDGVHSIIAAAGSGKSTLLLERVNKLHNTHNVPERKILVVSFTNATAKELRDDLSKMGMHSVHVGTFHSICGQILRDNSININPSNMIQEWQIDNCFKAIDKKVDVKDVINFISYQRNHLIGSDDKFVKRSGSAYKDEEYRKYFKAYKKLKEKNGSYDFDDYLLLCLELLQEQSSSTDYDYILVDEHQDSNKVQNELLKHWGNKGNLFVVGDYRQCFPAGTKISTEDSTKDIEDVKHGDMIKVASGHGETTIVSVSEVFKRKTNKESLITLETESGNMISATPEHIVFAHIGEIEVEQQSPEHVIQDRHELEITFTMFGTHENKGSTTGSKGYLKHNARFKVDKSTIELYGDKFVDDISLYPIKLVSDDGDYLIYEATATPSNFDEIIIDSITMSYSKRVLYDPVIRGDEPADVIFNINLTDQDKQFSFLRMDDISEGMEVAIVNSDGSIISDKVIKSSTEEYSDYVYDLNIDDYRNYIANGVIVHNCIYGFRGSDTKYIMDMSDDWGEAGVINVYTNYRSPKNIVENANEFIGKYYGNYKHHVDTESFHQFDGEIEVNSFSSREEEGVDVVSKIRRLIDNGTELDDIAVLYRNNAHADYVENELKRHDIEYDITNSSSFFKRREVAGILSFLRLIQDTEDNSAFEGAFRLRVQPLMYFSNNVLNSLQDYANIHEVSMFEALSKASYPQPWQKRNAITFTQHIKELQKIAEDDSDNVIKLINEIVHRFQIKRMVMEKYSHAPEREERINSIEVLKSFVKGNNLEQFITYVYNSTEKKKKKEYAVRLMTIHGSKGLEFDNVFVIGVQDSEFPSERAEILEEARLFYVATTRSKKNMWISEIGKGNQFIEEYRNEEKDEEKFDDDSVQQRIMEKILGGEV